MDISVFLWLILLKITSALTSRKLSTKISVMQDRLALLGELRSAQAGSRGRTNN